MWCSEPRRRRIVTGIAAACAALQLGCVEHALREKLSDFDYAPLPVPSPPMAEEGAIWRGDSPSGSFLFFDQKARGVGDLVTVVVQEDMRAEGSANTDLDRSSQVDAGLSSDVGFGSLLSSTFRRVLGLLGANTGPAPAPGTPINVIQSSHDSTFEGEGSTSRSGRFTAVVTCRVIGVLPGDVFHIRGRRMLLVNHEQQFLSIEGLVRQQDIGIDNMVVSASLAEARMSLDGIGVVDDKQRPGVVGRILDWVYPF